jgi:hypothetical protein
VEVRSDERQDAAFGRCRDRPRVIRDGVRDQDQARQGSRTDPSEILNAQVASYDVAIGDETRLMVGLFTGDERFVSYGTVDMSFAYLGDGEGAPPPEPGPDATARFLLVPGTDPPQPPPRQPAAVPASKGRGVYAADLTFHRAGYWEVEVTADVKRRGRLTATAAFVVLEEHKVPAPGDRAPRSDNLTIGSRAPREAVDSRWREGEELPDPILHKTTIEESIRKRRPVVAVFSTPVYCVSRFCGPITDMVQELARKYSDRVDFVHVEIWRDFERKKINETAAEWLLRDEDLSEPWVFLMGADGRIEGRWDNVATREEIEPLLQRLPASAPSS